MKEFDEQEMIATDLGSGFSGKIVAKAMYAYSQNMYLVLAENGEERWLYTDSVKVIEDQPPGESKNCK